MREGVLGCTGKKECVIACSGVLSFDADRGKQREFVGEQYQAVTMQGTRDAVGVKLPSIVIVIHYLYCSKHLCVVLLS